MTIEDLATRGVLCFGGEDWWYHNRGHCDMQFMRQFSKYGRVIYVNSIVMRKPNIAEGRMFWRRVIRKSRSISRGLAQVEDRFWVFSPATAPVHHIAWGRFINERLLRTQIQLAIRRVGLRCPLVWVNCPAACDTALALPRSALVYQRTDRYEEFPGVDAEQIRQYDRQLKEHAELTFFASRTLFEQEESQCRKATYVDHGVDYERFANASKNPWIPQELKGLRRPIAGFFGGIDAHTFDLPLMVNVVRELPDVTFVFVGKSSIDCTLLSRHSNAVMIGQRPYEQIPHYGKVFDVCLMPWKQNRWIEGCNPIKLKEYLALGKAVVSTTYPGLSSYIDLAHSCLDPKTFAHAVRHALSDGSPDKIAARRRRVAHESWANQARRVVEHLFASRQSVGLESTGRPE